ncbi:hypothetical protein BDV12DRAFT_199323 [Aspergillus spectabilis]
MADTTYELADHDKGGFTKSVKAVLFYKLHNADPETVVSSFEEGVRNATRHLPFMAGHLHFYASGKLCIMASPESSIEVNVRRFTSSECETFSVLARESFSPNNLDLTRFLPQEPTIKQPVSLIQLSLIEGGLALPLFHVIEKSKFKFNPPPPTFAGIFRITEPTIQQLKAQCKPYLSEVEYITSYDCISALVWKAFTRARLQVHPDKANASSRFVHHINVRSRDPEHKTSPGYFGNAVIGTLVGPVKANVLAKTDDHALAIAASQIRKSIQAIDVSTISHMTALQASLTDTELLIPNADFADMDLFMNTWYTGTADKYDLGGAAGPGPVAFRLHTGVPGACAGILPNLSSGNTRVFEIFVQAAVPEFEVFSKDLEFLKYFEHVV